MLDSAVCALLGRALMWGDGVPRGGKPGGLGGRHLCGDGDSGWGGRGGVAAGGSGGGGAGGCGGCDRGAGPGVRGLVGAGKVGFSTWQFADGSLARALHLGHCDLCSLGRALLVPLAPRSRFTAQVGNNLFMSRFAAPRRLLTPSCPALQQGGSLSSLALHADPEGRQPQGNPDRRRRSSYQVEQANPGAAATMPTSTRRRIARRDSRRRQP